MFAGGLKNGIENLSNLLGSAFPSGQYFNTQASGTFRKQSLGIAACGGNGGWMPKVSTKHVQRRIAELDSVAQPKRSSVLKRVLAFIILAIIAVAAFFSANRTSSDFLRLTLKQGSAESNRQLSDAEARAK